MKGKIVVFLWIDKALGLQKLGVILEKSTWMKGIDHNPGHSKGQGVLSVQEAEY